MCTCYQHFQMKSCRLISRVQCHFLVFMISFFISGIIDPRQSAHRLRPILSSKSVPNAASTYKSNTSRFLSSSNGKHEGNLEEFRKKQEQMEEEFYKNTPVESASPTTAKDTDNTAEDEHTNAIRRQILEAAMQFVPTAGWSKEAICKGAEKLGYPGVVHGMFPRGSAELIEYFYGNCTQRLVDWMEKETEGGTKVPSASAFVTRAVEQRLRMLSPYLDSWPQAIAVMSLPQNAVKSLANLLTLVDEICYYSGDKAVDVSDIVKGTES